MKTNDAGLNVRQFTARNILRCTAANGFNHDLSQWSLSDWMTALVGEVGEAANIIKKLNRHRDGIRGDNDDDQDAYSLFLKLQEELADIYIYLDLLVASAGYDLSRIVLAKFEATSKKIGYKE